MSPGRQEPHALSPLVEFFVPQELDASLDKRFVAHARSLNLALHIQRRAHGSRQFTVHGFNKRHGASQPVVVRQKKEKVPGQKEDSDTD
jgi:hypothetical protein